MMTSQRNGIETHVQDSGHQIQPQGDQPANNIPTYYISKNSRTCDIFYSCKKNSFYRKITDSNNQSEKGWTISEESNCFTNYCFFQYRPFKLRVKDNQGEKYLGERSKNVCCQDTLMEIKKYDENNNFIRITYYSSNSYYFINNYSNKIIRFQHILIQKYQKLYIRDRNIMNIR